MDAYERTLAYLPPLLRRVLELVPRKLRDETHEIRLRLGSPLTLSASDGEWWVLADGSTTTTRQSGLVYCRKEQLDDCFLRLCGYSVHTHQEELKQGFIHTDDGCRAGIGGTIVTENGVSVSMRQITSICLRVARPHIGCATDCLPYLLRQGIPVGTVLCGPPSSGKTSLLRDAARLLALGAGGRRLRVAVVDERGELSAGDALCDCDVLVGGNKASGILQAIRCLSPDVVVFDEWGGEDECRAIEQSLRCGVAVLTSCHGNVLDDLRYRPAVSRLLYGGGIEQLAQLEGYRSPGKVSRWLKVGDWIAEDRRTDLHYSGGYRGRRVEGVATEATRE